MDVDGEDGVTTEARACREQEGIDWSTSWNERHLYTSIGLE